MIVLVTQGSVTPVKTKKKRKKAIAPHTISEVKTRTCLLMLLHITAKGFLPPLLHVGILSPYAVFCCKRMNSANLKVEKVTIASLMIYCTRKTSLSYIYYHLKMSIRIRSGRQQSIHYQLQLIDLQIMNYKYNNLQKCAATWMKGRRSSEHWLHMHISSIFNTNSVKS